MKPTLVSLQHTAFQDIVARIRRELYYMGENSLIQVHGVSIQEIRPATTNHAGEAVLDAALFIADRFHVEIHLEIEITQNSVADLHYTALAVTLVDTESDSADTTDDVDVHDYYAFDTPHTLDSISTVVAEHVIDAITAGDII